MKPFEYSSSLATITDRYPAAEHLLRVICEGGDTDRLAIARQWLSEGIPFAFRKCPAVYESLRSWLSGKLDVEAKEISLYGSARLSYSLKPRQIGKPFGPESDLDLFVVSERLFQSMCDDFNRWSSDFRNGCILPKNAEKKYWKDNSDRGPKLIERGFMNSKMIPNREGYRTIRKINQALWKLRKKLKATEYAPIISEASLRCYKSWTCFERQALINLQSTAKQA